MKSEKAASSRILCILLLLVAFLSEKPLHAEKPLKAPEDLLLTTMEKELHRSQSELAKKDPAPYFASYNVTDGESLVFLSDMDGIQPSTRTRHSAADVGITLV